MKITLFLAVILLSNGLYAQKNYKQDRIVPIASAYSNLVMSGHDYFAQMFMVTALPQTNIRMTCQGKPITVDENGIGEVRFQAKGMGRQTWIGTISANVGGKDTAFRVEKEYDVIQPILLAAPTSNMILYQNCSNEIQTSAPLLGAAYRPVFIIDNGRAIPSNDLGTVVLCPNNLGQCKLYITSGGRGVGETLFRVIPTPPPYLHIVYKNYTSIDDSKPIEATAQIAVFAKPDDVFMNLMPKEANYKVLKINYDVFRNQTKVIEGSTKDNEIDLATLKLKSGDVLQITLEQVERVNAFGKTETVKLKQPKATFFIK